MAAYVGSRGIHQPFRVDDCGHGPPKPHLRGLRLGSQRQPAETIIMAPYRECFTKDGLTSMR